MRPGVARIAASHEPKMSPQATAALDMQITCHNVHSMSKMIQIRNVPDELHRELKIRAARSGMSLSDYLLQEVRAIAETPSLEELTARVRRRRPLASDRDSADIIRELREDS